MQENNTEKRTIRRMKRTFHGQNQETQKKKIKKKTSCATGYLC